MMNKVFRRLLDSRNYKEIRSLWEEWNAVDIAALLEEVEGAEQAVLFRLIPKDKAADVFSYLRGSVQTQLAESFAEEEMQQVFEQLHLDDAVDFLEELPANLVTRILRTTSGERRGGHQHAAAAIRRTAPAAS